jgi:hypothetical protein
LLIYLRLAIVRLTNIRQSVFLFLPPSINIGTNEEDVDDDEERTTEKFDDNRPVVMFYGSIENG